MYTVHKFTHCVKEHTFCKTTHFVLSISKQFFRVPIGKFQTWLIFFTQSAVVIVVTNMRCVSDLPDPPTRHTYLTHCDYQSNKHKGGRGEGGEVSLLLWGNRCLHTVPQGRRSDPYWTVHRVGEALGGEEHPPPCTLASRAPPRIQGGPLMENPLRGKGDPKDAHEIFSGDPQQVPMEPVRRPGDSLRRPLKCHILSFPLFTLSCFFLASDCSKRPRDLL